MITCIYITSGIVHSYFLRFRFILREIPHFVFRIGSYEMDRSAISLSVAAKTRTKELITTDLPPSVKEANTTHRLPNAMRVIRVIFEEQTPTLLSWPIYILFNLITPYKRYTRTVSGPIPTRPAASVQTGCNRAGGLQLLREDRFVNMSGSLNCYHGGYTYRLISWLLRRFSRGQ